MSATAVWALLLASCERAKGPEVVLYTSCDDYLLREIKPLFEKEAGIKLLIVGDTEATKTTGLVQRVIAEKDRPRADVWWSNEPMGTLKLAEQGLLAPSTPKALKEDFGGKWPAGLSSPDGLWWGFALRARVIVVNDERLVLRSEPGPTLAELAHPHWKGRIGMARPQFGTTRGQIAYLLASSSESEFRDWLRGLKRNGVRLYDGNSAVVRAVAHGEIDAGLTDSDDVVAGKRENWPVRQMRLDIREESGATFGKASMPIPNTVGLVKGGPHPKEAAALLDFLLSSKVEELLAKSDSRNRPIRAKLAQQVGDLPIPELEIPDFQEIHKAEPAAMKACTEILGE